MKRLLTFCLLLTVAIHVSTVSYSRIPVMNTLSDYIAKFHKTYIALVTSYIDNPQVNRVVKFGYNLAVSSSSNEDIWSYGGLLPLNIPAETLSIVSNSVQDDSNLTGARQLLINCIDEDGYEQQLVVVMDGTTPVVTTQTCKFVNRAVILSSGSNASNVGDITISQTGTTYILAYIPLGKSTTQQVMYQVPIDRRCYINNLYLSADKLSGSQPRVVFEVKVYNTVTTSTEYTIRRELLDTAGSSERAFPDFKEQPLLPGEIINIETDTDTNNTQVSATIDMTCMKI